MRRDRTKSDSARCDVTRSAPDRFVMHYIIPSREMEERTAIRPLNQTRINYALVLNSIDFFS